MARSNLPAEWDLGLDSRQRTDIGSAPHPERTSDSRIKTLSKCIMRHDEGTLEQKEDLYRWEYGAQ